MPGGRPGDAGGEAGLLGLVPQVAHLGHRPALHAVQERGLEQVVDVHAFTPAALQGHAERAGLERVRVGGELGCEAVVGRAAGAASSRGQPSSAGVDRSHDRLAQLRRRVHIDLSTHGENLERLRRVKAAYDPAGFFSFPQSIRPAAPPS